MKVAVMFSGGKDSSMALKYALDQGWKVEALISVKPKSTESFLYQFATVEWTKLSAKALDIPLIYITSEKIGPREEADELEKVFKNLEVNAILMGGVGLQETQIRELKRVAQKFEIEIIIPYEDYTSEELIEEEVKEGFEIVITNVASDGLGPEWLGRKIDKETLERLKILSKQYGFDIDFEGGYADTFVCDGPIFNKRIEFISTEKIWDTKTNSGYLEVKEAKLIPK